MVFVLLTVLLCSVLLQSYKGSRDKRALMLVWHCLNERKLCKGQQAGRMNGII